MPLPCTSGMSSHRSCPAATGRTPLIARGESVCPGVADPYRQGLDASFGGLADPGSFLGTRGTPGFHQGERPERVPREALGRALGVPRALEEPCVSLGLVWDCSRATPVWPGPTGRAQPPSLSCFPTKLAIRPAREGAIKDIPYPASLTHAEPIQHLVNVCTLS